MGDERAESVRGGPQPSPEEFRKTALAVGLAWLVPGAGHVFLGHVRRGLFFGLIIWGAFGLGLAHEGRLALRDGRQPLLTSLQIVANLGVGPADLLARRAVYKKVVYRMPTPQDGVRGQAWGGKFRERARSGVSIYGTAYLWTAGLMNLLLLFDVWDIGLRRKA